MANANEVFNSIGDGLANMGRWLISWVPGGNPGGTYTTVQDEKDSGVNYYAPPAPVAAAIQVATGQAPTALTSNSDFMSVAIMFLAGLIFINIIFRR